MIRRFFSHIIIATATFVLTTTLFLWVLNNRVFDPPTLNAELRKAGVFEEFSKLLPEIVTPEEEAQQEEKQQFQEIIDEIMTVTYVDKKIAELNSSVITFIKDGEPQPTLDLSDIPAQIEDRGFSPDEEFIDSLSEPINLNENGGFDRVHEIYKFFSTIAVFGVVLFVALMALEWFVAEKGKKLRRLSRVFLYAGLSYAVYWALIVALPRWGAPYIDRTVRAEYDTSGLVTAVLQAIEGLFAFYFLVFASVGIGITIILYILRHFMHGDVGKE